MSLDAKLVQRIHKEVPNGGNGFLTEGAEKEFLNAAKYLKETLNATDDDIIGMLHGLYDAMAEEYGA